MEMDGRESTGGVAKGEDVLGVLRTLLESPLGDDSGKSFLDMKDAIAVLFAQIASAELDPVAVAVVAQEKHHPLFARKFAAVNAHKTVQSWRVQEQRVLERFASSVDRLQEARDEAVTASKKVRDAEMHYQDAKADLALMRLNFTLKGIQDLLKPALRHRAIVPIMLAIMSQGDNENRSKFPAPRFDTKRVLDTLMRRIADDVFLQRFGELICDFVMRYDEEVGSLRRLSLAKAEEVVGDLEVGRVSPADILSQGQAGESEAAADAPEVGAEDQPQEPSPATTTEAKLDPDLGFPSWL